MGKKLGHDSTDSDVDEPPSGAEFILGSANWDERLASARKKREKILSRNATNGGNASPLNNGQFLSTRSKSKTAKSEDVLPGEETPSLEEILTTTNWNDRIAKATTRREQIIGQRRQVVPDSVSQPSGESKEPYKDVIRGAFSGLAPAQKTIKATASNLPAVISATIPIEEEKQQFRPLLYFTFAAALLIIGLILPGPIRNFASTTIDRAVTAFVGPEISSQPRLDHIIIATTTLAPLASPTIVQPFIKPVLPTSESDIISFATSTSFPLPNGRENALTVSTESHPSETTISNGISPIVAFESPKIARLQKGIPLDAGIAASVDVATIGNRANPTNLQPEIRMEVLPVAVPRFAISNAPITFSIAPTSINILLPEPTLGEIPGAAFHSDSWRPNNSVTVLSKPSMSDLVINSSALIDAVNVSAIIPELSAIVEPSTSNILLPEVSLIIARLTLDGGFLVPPASDAVIATPEPYVPPAETNATLALNGNFSIHVRAPQSLAEDRLTAFSNALRDTGFDVNDPKRVGFTVSKNHVRFYHADDAVAAGILAEAVEGASRDFTDYRPSPPSGTIEVWLAGKSSRGTTSRSAPRPRTQDPAITNLRNKLLQSLRRGDHL